MLVRKDDKSEAEHSLPYVCIIVGINATFYLKTKEKTLDIKRLRKLGNLILCYDSLIVDTERAEPLLSPHFPLCA
jgi:hypothetical protein